jgi:hypothetical protein
MCAILGPQLANSQDLASMSRRTDRRSASPSIFHLLAATLALSILPALADEPSSPVGYCAGPPCCSYERSSCSAGDSAALIAQSEVAAGDKPFCAALMKSQWSYLPLDRAHTVSKDDAQDLLSLPGALTDIWPKAGYFDINNDGKPEYLVWMTAYSGAGQGCDIEMYAEADSSLSHIVHSPLTQLLAENRCETYQRAFHFAGKVYIENRRTVSRSDLHFGLPSILTEVYLIEGLKRHSVCTFVLRD